MENHNTDLVSISHKLIAYLMKALENPDLAYRSSLMQLEGGYETLTYRFQLSGVVGEWANDLVLRLYPSFNGTQNARWESTVQNLLAGEGYSVFDVANTLVLTTIPAKHLTASMGGFFSDRLGFGSRVIFVCISVTPAFGRHIIGLLPG